MKNTLSILIIFFLSLGISICSKAQLSPPQRLQRQVDSILLVLKYAKEDSVKVNACLTLANLWSDVDPKQSISWLEEGKRYAIAGDLPKKLLKIRLTELRIHNVQGNFPLTLKAAAEISNEIEDADFMDQAAYLMSVGNASHKTGKYNDATEAFTKAYNLGRANRNPMVEVRAYMNLGMVYETLEQYDEMRKHLTQALQLAEQNHLMEDKMMIIMNLAFAEGRLNNHGKVIEYTQSAIPYYDSTNQQHALGLCYSNLAWSLMKSGKYDAALMHAQKSMVIRQKLGDKRGLARLHQILSRSYLELGKLDSTIHHANLGLTLSMENKLVVDIKDNFEVLSLAYERIGDDKKALYYLKQHLNWKDSARLKEGNKSIELQLNTYRNHYADSLNKANGIFIGGMKIPFSGISYIAAILLAAFVTSIAIYMFVKARKKKEESVAVVSDKSLENEEIAPSEQLKLMRERILLLEKQQEMQATKEFDELRQMIGSNKLHSEGYWNDFMLLFAKVHPDFFEKLKQRYPNLTQNEMRICALLKLNLSLLEISNALNITTESVRKARYRLYKKLNLASDQELINEIIML